MNLGAARARAGRMKPDSLDEQVRAAVPLRTGTHHTVTLLARTPEDEYREVRRERRPSAVRDLEFDAEVGNIVCQRTTSPASAASLERYGVVAGEGRVDWGSDADWVADFGPMGDVTRRGPRSPLNSAGKERGRVFIGEGEEVVGGAIEGVPSTSTD